MKDNLLGWLASKTFSDEHYGVALTEEELEHREELEEEYKEEIEEAKRIISENPGFEDFSYQDKINYASNLIVELRAKKEENKGKSL